jgi:hypothetical protein
MDQEIETYIMLLKHEMFAEDIKTVDKEFIEQIVLRAGGKSSEVGEVLNHPSIRKADSGGYFVD